MDLLHIFGGGRACWELSQEDRAVAEDHRQDVVEIVGDAASQAPDRLQPLRLADMRLEAVQLSQVVLDRGVREWVTVRVPHQKRGELGVDQLACDQMAELTAASIATALPKDGGASHAFFRVKIGKAQLC